MENITQTPQIKNEVEVGTEYTFNTAPEAPNMVLQGLGRVVDHIKLETRMIAFDALHRTNYRQIRHELVAQKKREEFEQSIGLVAVK
jgi:hypothetical protein